MWSKLRDFPCHERFSLDLDAAIAETHALVQRELNCEGEVARFYAGSLKVGAPEVGDLYERSIYLSLIFLQISEARFAEGKTQEAWAHIVHASQYIGAVDLLDQLGYMTLKDVKSREQRSLAGRLNKQSMDSDSLRGKAIEVMGLGVPNGGFRNKEAALVYLANKLDPHLRKINSNIKYENLPELLKKWRELPEFGSHLDAFLSSSVN